MALLYVPLLVFSPVISVAIKVLDPLIDPVCEGLANGIITVLDAYEKTKPPTGPCSKCMERTCPQRFSNCHNYHPLTDCIDWVDDKKSCNGKCGKYHRKWVGGRGLTERARRVPVAAKELPPIFIPEQRIFGKLTIGLRWDADNDRVNEHGTFAALGEWKTMNLGLGVFDLNGNLLHMIYSDENVWGTFSFKGDKLNYANGAIHNTGVDAKGGEAGRKKPGNFGYNTAIHIDFDRLPNNVGSLCVCASMVHRSLLIRLDNCRLGLLSTPSFTDDAHTLKLQEIPLLVNGELRNQTGYILGKFMRIATGWKFVPIQQQHGFEANEPVIQQLMKPLVQETSNVELPGALDIFEVRTISLTRDRTRVIPIKKVGCACFDVFGKLMNIPDPFSISHTKDSEIQLEFKTSEYKTLIKAVFLYVEHEGVPDGVNCFVVAAEQNPITCNISNIGGSAQIVASFIQISEGEESRWEANTFAIPVKQLAGRMEYDGNDDTRIRSVHENVVDIIYAQRLLPDHGSQLEVLQNLLAPTSQKLVVEVISGSGLAVKDVRTSDPYVVVKFGGQKLKTEVVKNTVNPTWNETFKFDLDAYSGTGDLQVILRCKDWNKLTKHASMGVVNFKLLDLATKKTKNDKTEKLILPMEKDMKHPKQSFSGHLVARVYFE